MSIRRPYVRGGRILYVIRPDPFEPPPLAVQLWTLLWRPGAGVALVLRSSPGLRRLGAATGAAGGLTGAVLWAMTAAEPGLGGVLAAPLGALLAGAAAAWALWWSAALALHLSGHLLGGLGPLLATQQVTGVAALITPVLAPLLGWCLTAGVGLPQLLALVPVLGWAAAVAYHLERRALMLPPGMAALAVLLPLAAVIGAGAGLAGLLFRLVPVGDIAL